MMHQGFAIYEIEVPNLYVYLLTCPEKHSAKLVIEREHSDARLRAATLDGRIDWAWLNTDKTGSLILARTRTSRTKRVLAHFSMDLMSDSPAIRSMLSIARGLDEPLIELIVNQVARLC